MSALLFHIAEARVWERVSDAYEPTDFAAEGFIHCSLAGQVMKVADTRFAGRRDMVLLAIDPRRVGAEIRFENTEGGTELFPHIYGRLERDAVVASERLQPGADGRFAVPAIV